MSSGTPLSSSSHHEHTTTSTTLAKVSALLEELPPHGRDALCADLDALVEQWKNNRKQQQQEDNIPAVSLLSLPPDAMKHILSMLRVRDIMRLCSVSAHFRQKLTPLPMRRRQAQRMTKTVMESALLAKVDATGVPPPTTPENSLRQWAMQLDKVEGMLLQVHLAPGKYNLEICTVPDANQNFSYHAIGELWLHPDGSVQGLTHEGDVTHEGDTTTESAMTCHVEHGTWTEHTINFVYRYGSALYDYAVRLESIVRDNSGDGAIAEEGVVKVELRGTWTHPQDIDSLINNGRVDPMVLRGPLFGHGGPVRHIADG